MVSLFFLFQLIKLHAVSRDLLPPKRYHGNLSKSLIDERRLQLENYLQKLIHRLLVQGNGFVKEEGRDEGSQLPLTHRPSSQGWAPECPCVCVFVLFRYGVWGLGSSMTI